MTSQLKIEQLNRLRSRITVLRQAGKDELFRAAAMLVNPYELMSREADHSVISRAYFKLWEILYVYKDSIFSDISTGKSVHLCEAPGAFVQAIQDFWDINLKQTPSQWSTVSVTLPDDLEWKTKEPVIFADILAPDRTWQMHPQFTNVDVVTGDGGFEIHGDDKNDQETLNFPLFQAQVTLGTAMLRPGGSLIVKFFDMFRDATRSVLGDLYVHFEEVHIVKPMGSRICNSERYVVALRKRDMPASQDDVPNFDLMSCEFADRQITALGHALTIAQQYSSAKPYTLIQSHRTDSFSRKRARDGLQKMGWYDY